MRRIALLGVGLVALIGASKPAGAYYGGWGYYPPPPPYYYYYVPYGAYAAPYDEPPRPFWRAPRAEVSSHRWRRRASVHRVRVTRHRTILRTAPRGLVNPLLGPLPAR